MPMCPHVVIHSQMEALRGFLPEVTVAVQVNVVPGISGIGPQLSLGTHKRLKRLWVPKKS
jgi:hypothetical protein